MRITSPRSTSAVCVLAALLLPAAQAAAQTPHQLVPVLTDQAALPLSDRFGPASSYAVSETGDLAFLGARGTALFYRPAGAGEITRVMQWGDEVPGLAGSRLLQFTSMLMSANGTVAAFARAAIVGDRVASAVLVYDGSTLRTALTSRDLIPGGGGPRFDLGFSIQASNAAGEVLIQAVVGTTGASAVYLVPVSGPPVRVAGVGDPLPATGGTISTFGAGGFSLNAAGQVTFVAGISGGTGTQGVFLWQNGAITKVVAQGDVNPQGGTYANPGTTRLNDAGLVAVAISNALVTYTQSDGLTVAVPAGSAAPAPLGGTLGTALSVTALSSGGDAILTANVSGGAGPNAMLRYRHGAGLEVIAYQGMPAPGDALARTFGSSVVAVTVNAAGAVAFQGNASGGQPIAIYRQASGGALTPVVFHGAAAPDGGAHFLTGGTAFVLSTGDVAGRTGITGDAASFQGIFLWSVSTSTLMSTAGTLPAGARTVVSATFLTGSGDYIGLHAQRAGGLPSLVAHAVQAGTTAVLATEGDAVPGTGGALLELGAANTGLVGSGGHMIQPAFLVGGAAGHARRTAIVRAGLAQPLEIVLVDGAQDEGGRTLTGSATAVSTVRPVLINAAGAVPFAATVNGGNRGVFVSIAGNPVPQKVWVSGDQVMTPSGPASITGSAATPAGINDLGQVVFAVGSRLFIATPGEMPVAIALNGGAVPGGGTFNTFATAPSLNGAGHVAFMATVSGGARGLFLWSQADGLSAVARHGDPSPAGGTFSFPASATNDVSLNDQGDVLFRVDVSGGSGTAGIFIRRGPQAAITTVAVVGQPAPGTQDVFRTLPASLNGWAGEYQQLSASGQVAFFATAGLGGTSLPQPGWWHAEPDGALQPIVLVPATGPAFGEGTLGSVHSTSSWLSGDRYAVWAGVADESFTGGLFVYQRVAGVETLEGEDVVVAPVDAVTGTSVTVTFGNVITVGETTLTAIAEGPAPPPAGFELAGVYFDLSTTAEFEGPVQVCFSYAGVDLGAVTPRLFHYEDGAWVDITTSLDTEAQTICGMTMSFSPFAIFASPIVRVGFHAPVSQTPGFVNVVKAGATVPLKFNVYVNGVEQTDTAGLRFGVWSVGCSGTTAEDPVDFTTSGATSLRYDASEGVFIQTWKTPAAPGCYAVRMTTTVDGLSIGALFRLR